MSGITLTEVADATIPTPASGKVTVYFSTEEAGPAWKDDAAAVTALQGTTGATGPGYAATSTTSLAIGTGSKAFTTQAGLAYSAGARVRASSAADVADFMEGVVASYSGTTLTVTVDLTGGTGTDADWNINLAGEAPSVWLGAWSGATAYVEGDAVSNGGSSYVCILGHTNQEPPNGTYWDVLAAGAGSDLDAIITASSGQDIADALAGAAAPAAGNVFATIADVAAAGGILCVITHNANQTIATSSSTKLLWNTDTEDANALHFTSAANLTGTVAKTATSANIVGTGTAFTTELAVNQVISIPGTATEIGVVKAITDDTHLELWQTMANNATGQTATRRNEYIGIPAGRSWGELVAGIEIGFHATGYRGLVVLRNGAAFRLVKVMAVTTTSQETRMQISTGKFKFAPGDYLAVEITQTSGGNLDVTGNTAYSPFLSLTLD